MIKEFIVFNPRLKFKSQRFSDAVQVVFDVSPNTGEYIGNNCVWKIPTNLNYLPAPMEYTSNHVTLILSPKTIPNNQVERIEQLLPSIDLELKCFGEVKFKTSVNVSMEQFNEELLIASEFSHPINILLYGEVGSGKSTLVNSIFSAVSNDLQSIAVTSNSNSHSTKRLSKFRLSLFNHTTHSMVKSNIRLTDTVGVSNNNYQLKESIDFIFQGGAPDIMLEENMIGLEKEISKLESDLEYYSLAFEVEFVTSEQENLYSKLRDEETAKVLLTSYNGDISSIEKLEKVIQFKNKNKGRVDILKSEHESIRKTLLEKKQQLSVMQQEMKQKQQITSASLDSKIHSIIFLITHSTASVSNSDLLKNIKMVLTVAQDMGYNPVVGVTKILTTDFAKARKEVSLVLGIPYNSVYIVQANLYQPTKQFDVDKQSFNILLAAVKRARQYLNSKLAEES